MKKTVILFCALISFLLTSCDNSPGKVRDTVDTFLKAYFAMEYEQAFACCTPELAEIMEATISDMEFPDESVKAKIREASLKTTYKITEIDTKSEKGKAFVKYNIFPTDGKVIEKSMYLSRNEDNKWLVSGMK